MLRARRSAKKRTIRVKTCNPARRLAWRDRTPVECGVQPKRLAKVRERERLPKGARPHSWRNNEHQGQARRLPCAASRRPLTQLNFPFQEIEYESEEFADVVHYRLFDRLRP